MMGGETWRLATQMEGRGAGEALRSSITLRVQVPKYEVYTLNHNHNS